MKLPLLLLFIAALLAWGAFELEQPEAAAPIVAAQRNEAASAARPQHGREGLRVRDVSAATVAPLFRAATTPTALAVPQPGERFVLVGLAGTGPARVAFLRDEADQRTITARVGDDVGAWRLESATERCALLRRARRTLNLCV